MLTRPFDKLLPSVVKKKKIDIKYPKGYQHWRKKFYSTLRETSGDVNKALDKIHGKTKKVLDKT